MPNRAGLFWGLVLGIFSYVGFESATTLGDEAKQPLRNIPRAVIISTIASGIFFCADVLHSGARVFRVPPVKFNESTAPMSDLANFAGVGFFGIVISMGAAVSMFACSLASINAGARIFFSMGRHGIFHRSIGRAHGRNETPYIAITLFALATFLVPTIMNMSGVKDIRYLRVYRHDRYLRLFSCLYLDFDCSSCFIYTVKHQLRWTDALFCYFGDRLHAHSCFRQHRSPR